MNTHWMIHTHGDPLGALQNFVKMLWEQTDLDAMIVAPTNGKHVLESPAKLEELNPFRPLMKLNRTLTFLKRPLITTGKNWRTQ